MPDSKMGPCSFLETGRQRKTVPLKKRGAKKGKSFGELSRESKVGSYPQNKRDLAKLLEHRVALVKRRQIKAQGKKVEAGGQGLDHLGK